MNQSDQREERGPPNTNRFEIIRRIGRGGMGVVYEALDKERELHVALKTMRYRSTSSLLQFKREFRLLAEIVHPNLIPLYEFFSDGSECFFTMELIKDGSDLLSYVGTPASVSRSTTLAARSNDDLPTSELSGSETSLYHLLRPENLDLDKLRNAFHQLATGVRALHTAGKLHRDLKPSNVLVRSDGRVVLLDFGLVAEITADTPLSEADGLANRIETSRKPSDVVNRVVGTAWYMAPEQAAGGVLTQASDWYALGVMLFRALTGELPFSGHRRQVMWEKRSRRSPAPSDLVDDIPEDLNQLCMELLDRDASRRPDGQQVLARLISDPPRSETRPTDLPASIPFIGRDSHFSKLRSGFQRMMDGQLVIQYIVGKSGTGKSRLVDRFVKEIARPGDALVLSSRCYEQESVPYKGMDGLVDALTQFLLRLPPDQRSEMLPKDASALARVFPVLTQISGFATMRRDERSATDLHELRRRAHGALRDLIANIGKQHPLVLYIDDLHWGDADSAAVLQHLIRPPDAPRMMVIACCRSEIGMNPCLNALKSDALDDSSVERAELALGPLDPAESRELARQLLSDDVAQADAYADRIAREAHGIPYFIIELARRIGSGTDRELPPTAIGVLALDQVLWNRIEQLTSQQRSLLQVVAVAAQPIRMRDALSAAQLHTADYPVVAPLRASHLLCTFGSDLEDDVAVFHDRIRETVVQHLSSEERRSCHHCLAQSLEVGGNVDPERIAQHFHAAGVPDRAGAYYRMAADRSAEQLAFDRAARLYRFSLDLLPLEQQDRKELLVAMADALANAGRGAEAGRHYDEAAELSSGIDESELRRMAAYQFLITGHFDAGRATTARVLKAFKLELAPTPNRALALLLWQRMKLRLRGLRFRPRDQWQISPYDRARIDACWGTSIGLGIIDIVRAAEFQTRGLLYALQSGDPYRVARALALEAIHNSARGNRARRRTAQLLTAADRLGVELNDPYITAILTLSRGATAWLEGRFSDAKLHVLQAQRMFFEKCIGTTWERDTARTYESFVLVNLGEFEELARVAQVYREEAESRGDLYAATNIGVYALPHSLLISRGDPRAAFETANESIHKWSKGFFHSQHMLAWVTEIEAALYRNDGLNAWQAVRKHWQDYRRSLIPRVQHPRIQLLYSEARSAILAAGQSNDPKPFRLAAKRNASKLARERRVWASGLAAIIRAGLAHQSGEPERSIEQLTRAHQSLQSVKADAQAAAVRRRLGLLTQGDRGKEWVREAESWMSTHGIAEPDRVTDMYVPGFSPEQ